jgi:hypothetical protein
MLKCIREKNLKYLNSGGIKLEKLRKLSISPSNYNLVKSKESKEN